MRWLSSPLLGVIDVAGKVEIILEFYFLCRFLSLIDFYGDCKLLNYLIQNNNNNKILKCFNYYSGT